jgi:hypothetical protein
MIFVIGRMAGMVVMLWLVAAGCNSGEKKPVGDVREAEAGPECFLFVQGRDSIKLSMTQENGGVHGKLAYLFYEKDKSMGTIEGDMRGDTLFVNYSFTSEGMFSTRELAFLQKEDRLLMGTGEIENRGNSDVFQNPAEIEFSESVVLKKISCEEMGEAVVL